MKRRMLYAGWSMVCSALVLKLVFCYVAISEYLVHKIICMARVLSSLRCHLVAPITRSEKPMKLMEAGKQKARNQPRRNGGREMLNNHFQ